MKRYLKSYVILAVIAIAIVALDQVTKTWVRTNIPPGASITPIEALSPFFKIVHWYNTGVAFGLFQGLGDIFVVLAILVSLAIIYYYPRVPERDWTLRLAMGLQLGGALGNLVDRITIGHVTDFLAFGDFPVFNVADSSITVGVGILLLGMFLQERKIKHSIEGTRNLETPNETTNKGEAH
ncbi:MAG: signal peptidase II [Anaerolineaceae bacterium]|nr:signal peptidase II [Anaerolineaceae bacterium]